MTVIPSLATRCRRWVPSWAKSIAAPSRCGNTDPRPRHKCNGGTSTVDSASQNRQQDTSAALTHSPRTYLVRTLQRPLVVCPSWCSVTPAKHVDELAGLDGG